jgi:hypothetical protein
MTSMQHAEILMKKHETLDRLLDRAYSHRYQDADILALKKRKLMVKDELSRLALTGWREEARRIAI